MKLIEQQLLYATQRGDKEVVLFTSNGFVKRNGALVMGRGAARKVRDLYPTADKRFGELALQYGSTYEGDAAGPQGVRYGLIVLGHKVCNILGAFQVKWHWADKADLDMIKFSTDLLLQRCESVPDFTIHLNFPGIGNGGRTKEEVLPIIEQLPDQVLVYILPEMHPKGF